MQEIRAIPRRSCQLRTTRRQFLAGGTVLSVGAGLAQVATTLAADPSEDESPIHREIDIKAPTRRVYEEQTRMPDIMHYLKIHAPADEVYRAITTADGIRGWWTRDAALEPKVGSIGEFGFNGRRFVAILKIVELKQPTQVKWQITNSAWSGDTIEFDPSAEEKDTRLFFAHRGFAQADQRYASATTRWGFYLLSLKQYLETGKGRPNPDDSDF